MLSGWYAQGTSNHVGVMITGDNSKYNSVKNGQCDTDTAAFLCVYVSPTLNDNSTNEVALNWGGGYTNIPNPPIVGCWNPNSNTNGSYNNLYMMECDASNAGVAGTRIFSWDYTGGLNIYGTGTTLPGNGYNTIMSGNASTTNYTDTIPAATGTFMLGTGSFVSGDCPQFSGTLGVQVDSGAPCATFIAKGTTFTLGTGTGACATTSTLVGAPTAGSFKCTGTAGASTQVINLPTATHGWTCFASDLTAATAWAISATTTTSCTIKGTIATTSDVVSFGAIGY